jgi:hypothetical protein
MTKTITLLFTSFLLCSIFCFSTTHAATINAASCSQADVQAAINASSDNDTVLIPAGTCTYTTQIQDKSSVYVNKSITLQGAGIDSTIIVDATDDDWEETCFWITKKARITNMTFSGISDGGCGTVHVRGSGSGIKDVRIDHCKFIVESGYAIEASGYAYGVIDHCNFSNTTNSSFISIFADGEASWARPSSLGTANAFYIEDCTFYTNSSASDNRRPVWGQDGARICFRYNTVTNLAMDMHGYCGDTGTFSFEIYNNIYNNTSGRNLARWFFLRGGSGVIYNNTMTNSGTLSNDIVLTDYRVDDPYTNPCIGAALSCCCQYPCNQQIGRGQNQTLDPAYFWNNTVNGSPASVSVFDFGTGDCEGVSRCNKTQNMTDFIKLNRDYYVNIEKPGYTPYTYPHPLVSTPTTTTVDVTKPSTPSNLKIIIQ